MKLTATIVRSDAGRWTLRHESPDLGRVEITAPTREEALEKLRGELRYRLELCPCSGESYQHIDIDIAAG